MSHPAVEGRNIGPGHSPLAPQIVDSWIQRRIAVIWALLLFNTLTPIGGRTVVPVPLRVAQLFTMGALGLAILLALSINRRLYVRPNLVLSLYSLLVVIGLMSSMRGTAGLGAILRCGRMAAFVAVLWLLTPWWGRRDMLLLRCHLRALVGVCATVVAGLLIAPGAALSVDGRLSGALWPVWPTAVAHFAAIAAGIGGVLWLAGSMNRGRALLLVFGGTTLVLLSQTRIALVGLVLGMTCAAFSLLLARHRARTVFTGALLLAPFLFLTLAPALSAYFTRGQTTQEISNLTGRRQVWEAMLNTPRSGVEEWFGHGLSDKSFGGRSIDNSWLATYQDQGLLGVTTVGLIILFLLVFPAFAPTGPARAVAIFIVVFCVVDSYTEVGLGDASSYLLDLVAAASLLFSDADAGNSAEIRAG